MDGIVKEGDGGCSVTEDAEPDQRLFGEEVFVCDENYFATDTEYEGDQSAPG